MANFLFVFLTFFVATVLGHGRMMDPAGRSTIWRLDKFKSLDAPVNYEDNGLKCGGVHQEDNPGTDCGVCGDNIADPAPRNNEIGGKYDRGIITGSYKKGQVMDIELDLTASHKGYMEWRLCTDPKNETQACFNEHVLKLVEGKRIGGTKYEAGENGIKRVKVKLPKGVTCERCIVQWNYRGANDFGKFRNGTGCVGCGPQVTFRACSDIQIL